ncbi:hypothetical protein DM02DRAFT_543892 [Periconia macrospinosa]|uniref:DUF7580 domain-containing protein n=1 Tax=Periconia macrospinosa TaxID=97972 RepID=A0A2V1D2S0_9PLEO|nr:hypothetical protein DM02DRAFT_543892 [Periconia macrospinosa]
MVTGVETAGLVLAAIPLIICALEHYESAIGPTKAFFHWKGNLSKATNELYVLHASYDQTLRVLLNPITSKEDLVTMVENIESDLWTRGDIAEDLQCHLGTAYVAVILEIEQIASGLLEIVKHLNIARAQQPSQQNLHSIVQANPPASSSPDPRKRFFFRERVKFTMKRQNLKERMDILRKSIETLAGFAERAEKLDDGPSRQWCKVKFSAPLASIRENACKVHKVLLSHWCASHTPHRVGILLEERLHRQKRGRQSSRGFSEPIATADRFALCLDEHLPNTRWLATEFRVIELPKRYSLPLSTTSTVTFTVTSTTPQNNNTPYSNPSQLVEVVEICSYLQQRTDPVVGFCLDDSNKLRAYPGDFGQVRHAAQELTLTQILPQLPQKLANGDVYRLAITLAASVLQLIETPWLDGAWNKGAIIFTRLCSNVSGNVDIKYPLLIKDFTPSAHTTPPKNAVAAMRERRALLSLGIMLLEINSAQSLESVRIPQDLGTSQTPDNDSDLITAHRWLLDQETQGNLSHGFLSAITSCLQAYLNPRADFSDPEFCRHIEETVIKPLETEMQCLLYGL